MVLLNLFDTFVKCSSNVKLLSNVNPECVSDDAWEKLALAGYYRAKLPEGQCIWALRISYFS